MNALCAKFVLLLTATAQPGVCSQIKRAFIIKKHLLASGRYAVLKRRRQRYQNIIEPVYTATISMYTLKFASFSVVTNARALASFFRDWFLFL
jgi:hypothetical protein